MILHRLMTWTHTLARIPFRRGDPYNTSWTFSDRDIDRNLAEETVDQADEIAREELERINRRLLRRYQRRIQEHYVSNITLNEGNDDRQPLITDNPTRYGTLITRTADNGTATSI
jgi:hypothetical protein